MRHVFAVLVIGSAVAAACADQNLPTETAPELVRAPVAELIQLSEQETRQRFTVTGKLVNLGSNYFTDRRLVLLDVKTDASIAVRPWLPIEAYPGRDADAPQPKTMAEFLDKTVELVVTPTRAPVKSMGIVPVLEVHSARILEE